MLKKTENSPYLTSNILSTLTNSNQENKATIRKKLKYQIIYLFIVTTAVGMLSNPFKDFNTLFNAYINILKKQKKFLLIVIGDNRN